MSGLYGLYPLGDWLPDVPLRDQRHFRGRATGEFRAPRAGEWYLSGGLVHAYRAPNDLTLEFHIAEVVRVRTTTVIEVVE